MPDLEKIEETLSDLFSWLIINRKIKRSVQTATKIAYTAKTVSDPEIKRDLNAQQAKLNKQRDELEEEIGQIEDKFLKNAVCKSSAGNKET